MTDAVTDIRNEMARLSHIMQDLVTRQYGQVPPAPTISPISVQEAISNSCRNVQQATQTASTQVEADQQSQRPAASPNPSQATLSTQQQQHQASQIPLPDSSENSVASNRSTVSTSSEQTSRSEQSAHSTTSSKVKSPPSKRTRQSDLGRYRFLASPDADMNDPHDEFGSDQVFEDTDMFDSVITDAIRMNLDVTRFEPRVARDVVATQPWFDEDLPSSVFPVDPSTQSPPTTDTAPLNSRNTDQMSSAGAETS